MIFLEWNPKSTVAEFTYTYSVVREEKMNYLGIEEIILM